MEQLILKNTLPCLYHMHKNMHLFGDNLSYKVQIFSPTKHQQDTIKQYTA